MTWATSNLSLSWDKRGIRQQESIFLLVHERERERGEEGKRRVKLPFKLYEVIWIGFHRAKNESSSDIRGVRVGT